MVLSQVWHWKYFFEVSMFRLYTSTCVHAGVPNYFRESSNYMNDNIIIMENFPPSFLSFLHPSHIPRSLPEGLFELSGSCLLRCPENFFSDEGRCIPCDGPCPRGKSELIITIATMVSNSGILRQVLMNFCKTTEWLWKYILGFLKLRTWQMHCEIEYVV